ncbi:HET-domain-containing protein [Diaporthe amygdali]|uniref:HET-domain-containing protein n=1 Tax=Phomopsis amygdali TaxID=1214568 RepID=UPI0022FEAB38|nr:HET-domain-containing protein [Diaporthe amygdali]KAJ0124359.1 HET-domain-containing protein [Diaporthe amygdali]
MVAGTDRILGHVRIKAVDQREADQAQRFESAPIIDFQAILRLLHKCEESHDHNNWDLPRYQSPTSIQLIDVEYMMVIPATTGYRYIALSYVWGEHDHFAATTKTREPLGHKRGLDRYMGKIPQTIKDAMDVVKGLGERYLWVDTLCIEQDNTTQKDVHIRRMDVIYSHALITIIAHSGVAATSPLPGLRSGTRLGLPTKRIDNIVISVEAPKLWDSGAPHERRGWTLQEQLMAKRCLYFDCHTTWFQCGKGMCRELDATGDGLYEYLQPPASFDMNSLRSTLMEATVNRRFEDVWQTYATIVERYRTRELRYIEDTILAIQGVTQVVADLLSVPLISTVPSKFIPRSMQFYFTGEGLVPGRNETAPSWSWAGWHDSIFFDDQSVAEPVTVEAVELDMKVGYKAHKLMRTPIKTSYRQQAPRLQSQQRNHPRQRRFTYFLKSSVCPPKLQPLHSRHTDRLW